MANMRKLSLSVASLRRLAKERRVMARWWAQKQTDGSNFSEVMQWPQRCEVEAKGQSKASTCTQTGRERERERAAACPSVCWLELVTSGAAPPPPPTPDDAGSHIHNCLQIGSSLSQSHLICFGFREKVKMVKRLP